MRIRKLLAVLALAAVLPIAAACGADNTTAMETTSSTTTTDTTGSGTTMDGTANGVPQGGGPAVARAASTSPRCPPKRN